MIAIRFHVLARLFLFLVIVPAIGFGANQAVELIEKNAIEAARLQQKIDLLDDETRALYTDYQALQTQLESLTIYVEQLSQLVADQQATIQNYKDNIAQAKELRRYILPLTEQMIDALEEWIVADLPFLSKERHRRIEYLRSMLLSANFSAVEKLSRVFEAYQIEVEYGHTLETYQGTLSNGKVVDFLRIGRSILIYQSLDGKQFGIWDGQSGDWQVLHKDYHQSAQQGFRIARRTASPSLLLMPVRVMQKTLNSFGQSP